MQIKIHRCHLTPVRLDIIKKTVDGEHWQGWRKGDSCVLLVEIYFGIATMENNMEFLQQISNTLPSDSSNHTSGYRSKRNENSMYIKEIDACPCMNMFTAAFFSF